MAPRIIWGSNCEKFPPSPAREFPVNALDHDLSDCVPNEKVNLFLSTRGYFFIFNALSVKSHFAIIIRSCRDTGFQTPCVCTNTTPLSMYKVTFPKEYKAFPSKRLLGIGMNKRLFSSAWKTNNNETLVFLWKVRNRKLQKNKNNNNDNNKRTSRGHAIACQEL